MNAIAGEGFGHGKVILLGEHSVVHGQPALAAGITAGVRVTARAGSGRLRVPAWQLDATTGDGSQVGCALDAVLRPLQALDLDLDADAAIPARAGLGSSAAFSVAVARAALAARGGQPDGQHDDHDRQRALEAAACGERVFHGSPSGVDAAAAAFGGVGRFTRAEGWKSVPLARPFQLCVGLSGCARSTGALVGGVRQLLDHQPSACRIIELLGELAETGTRAVSNGDLAALGGLMDMAHGLLAALGVSTAELEALVHGARAAGAAGAKLTGAGGGGAVIALALGREQSVLERWRKDGFQCFATGVGS